MKPIYYYTIVIIVLMALLLLTGCRTLTPYEQGELERYKRKFRLPPEPYSVQAIMTDFRCYIPNERGCIEVRGYDPLSDVISFLEKGYCVEYEEGQTNE